MARSDNFFRNLVKNSSDVMNVSILAKVDSYNSSNNTMNVIPLLKNSRNKELPFLINVPVMILGNTDYNIKIPVKKGDKVLIIYLDYDSDNILIDGKTIGSDTDRTHSFEDAIALPFTFNPLESAYSPTSNIKIKSSTKTIDINVLSDKIDNFESRIKALENK